LIITCHKWSQTYWATAILQEYVHYFFLRTNERESCSFYLWRHQASMKCSDNPVTSCWSRTSRI
jgi:hypothetical protein